MIILTNAPTSKIHDWVTGNNPNMTYEKLMQCFYVKRLFDSENDSPENADVIGFDEAYDEMGALPLNNEWKKERNKLLKIIGNTMKEKGMDVLDVRRNSIIVKNNSNGIGCRIKIGKHK